VKRTAADMVLLGRVWAELGSGRITEAFLPSDKRHFVEGYISGQHITVNPAPSVVDSAIHEILHRLQPAWSESYVRRTTTLILRRMTDEEVAAFYAEFQKRARKRKRPVRLRNDCD
jgi:hypothetical protein